MVNITHYERKLKGIKLLLQEEKNRKHKNNVKIKRLENCKIDCNRRLRLKRIELKRKRNAISRKGLKGRTKKGRRKMFSHFKEK